MATEVISRVDKFGLMNTFNPYKNSLSLRNVSNQRFRIDNKATYADTNVIAVSTGLIPNYEAFLGGGITFNILNPTSQTVEAILQPKIVDLGSGIVPMVNEIHWFDVVGMQGDFYVNSQWAGYILEIGGNIETCSITAEDINGMNSRIKTNADNITANNNNLTNKVNAVENRFAGCLKRERWFSQSGQSKTTEAWRTNGTVITVPANFIGTVSYSFDLRGGFALFLIGTTDAGLDGDKIYTVGTGLGSGCGFVSGTGSSYTYTINCSNTFSLCTTNTAKTVCCHCVKTVQDAYAYAYYTVEGWVYKEV